MPTSPKPHTVTVEIVGDRDFLRVTRRPAGPAGLRRHTIDGVSFFTDYLQPDSPVGVVIPLNEGSAWQSRHALWCHEFLRTDDGVAIEWIAHDGLPKEFVDEVTSFAASPEGFGYLLRHLTWLSSGDRTSPLLWLIDSARIEMQLARYESFTDCLTPSRTLDRVVTVLGQLGMATEGNLPSVNRPEWVEAWLTSLEHTIQAIRGEGVAGLSNQEPALTSIEWDIELYRLLEDSSRPSVLTLRGANANKGATQFRDFGKVEILVPGLSIVDVSESGGNSGVETLWLQAQHRPWHDVWLQLFDVHGIPRFVKRVLPTEWTTESSVYRVATRILVADPLAESRIVLTVAPPLASSIDLDTSTISASAIKSAKRSAVARGSGQKDECTTTASRLWKLAESVDPDSAVLFLSVAKELYSVGGGNEAIVDLLESERRNLAPTWAAVFCDDSGGTPPLSTDVVAVQAWLEVIARDILLDCWQKRQTTKGPTLTNELAEWLQHFFGPASEHDELILLRFEALVADLTQIAWVPQLPDDTTILLSMSIEEYQTFSNIFWQGRHS